MDIYMLFINLQASMPGQINQLKHNEVSQFSQFFSRRNMFKMSLLLEL